MEAGAKAMAEVAIKAQIAAVKEVMVNYYRLSKDDTMDEAREPRTQEKPPLVGTWEATMAS